MITRTSILCEESTNRERTSSQDSSLHSLVSSGYRSRASSDVGAKSSDHISLSSSMMGRGESPSPYLMRFCRSLSSYPTNSAILP